MLSSMSFKKNKKLMKLKKPLLHSDLRKNKVDNSTFSYFFY